MSGVVGAAQLLVCETQLFRAIVANLGLFAEVLEEDILMVISETAGENWWAAGRVVDPATGYDERMSIR